MPSGWRIAARSSTHRNGSVGEGKHFKVLKFRTMIQDAERQTGQVWAAEDDPRLTKVGKTLRRLHLDEIPQVINIVRGEMSLVGPRPERPALAEQFNREVPGFSQRLRVRPGIAGLAQVRGSYWTDPSYKLKYDNLYIETMSPWLDIKLLVSRRLGCHQARLFGP